MPGSKNKVGDNNKSSKITTFVGNIRNKFAKNKKDIPELVVSSNNEELPTISKKKQDKHDKKTRHQAEKLKKQQDTKQELEKKYRRSLYTEDMSQKRLDLYNKEYQNAIESKDTINSKILHKQIEQHTKYVKKAQNKVDELNKLMKKSFSNDASNKESWEEKDAAIRQEVANAANIAAQNIKQYFDVQIPKMGNVGLNKQALAQQGHDGPITLSQDEIREIRRQVQERQDKKDLRNNQVKANQNSKQEGSQYTQIEQASKQTEAGIIPLKDVISEKINIQDEALKARNSEVSTKISLRDTDDDDFEREIETQLKSTFDDSDRKRFEAIIDKKIESAEKEYKVSTQNQELMNVLTINEKSLQDALDPKINRNYTELSEGEIAKINEELKEIKGGKVELTKLIESSFEYQQSIQEQQSNQNPTDKLVNEAAGLKAKLDLVNKGMIDLSEAEINKTNQRIKEIKETQNKIFESVPSTEREGFLKELTKNENKERLKNYENNIIRAENEDEERLKNYDDNTERAENASSKDYKRPGEKERLANENYLKSQREAFIQAGEDGKAANLKNDGTLTVDGELVDTRAKLINSDAETSNIITRAYNNLIKKVRDIGNRIKDTISPNRNKNSSNNQEKDDKAHFRVFDTTIKEDLLYIKYLLSKVTGRKLIPLSEQQIEQAKRIGAHKPQYKENMTQNPQYWNPSNKGYESKNKKGNTPKQQR